MKSFLTVAVAAAAALALSACSSIPGMSGASSASSQFNDNLMKIATDPNCGHTDEFHVILGAIPSGSIDLKRQCDAKVQASVAPEVAPH